MQQRARRYYKYYNAPYPRITSVILEDYRSNKSLTDCLETLEQLGFYSQSAIAELAHLQSGGVQ